MANKFTNRVVAVIRVKMQGRVKMTHILLETAAIILSTLVFFPLAMITQHFNQNCLLNSNIHVIKHTNDSVSLDLTRTVFGDLDDCNYTTFLSVVVALHALIWIWFFFHQDNLTMSDGSSVNLFLPALLTHFILFICTIVSSVKIGEGFSTWCDQIETNNKGHFSESSCKSYQSLPWTEERSYFYTYNEMALISSWILVVFILISMVMTCVHLYWDFMSTVYAKESKGSMETSGFVDNGVGITNKLAWSYSTDGFYTDSMESDSCVGGGEAVGPTTEKDSPAVSLRDVVVNASIHTPRGAGGLGQVVEEEEGAEASDNSIGLRNRGSAVGTQ